MEKIVNEKAVKLKGVEVPRYIVDREGNVTKKGKLLKYRIHSGREYVSIKIDREYKVVQVAEIVLESFMGRPSDPSQKTVGFRDGVTTNSKLVNLFWTNLRNWWEDSRVIIPDSIIEKVLKESKSELTESTKELADRLNLQKGVVDYIIDTNGNLNNKIEGELEELTDDIEPAVEDKSLGVEGTGIVVPIKSPGKRIGMKHVGRYGMSGEAKPIVVEGDKPSYPENHETINSMKLPPDQIGRVGVINNIEKVEVKEEEPSQVKKDCDYIINHEIPALRYAGVKTKKILVFILYKYGKEVYEQFILHHVEKL